ncbi:unnamed protein product [Schistocephalus solidus]|uniref:Titin n=1 Tax=Schistocephalus solidus TaxID=70667 RepID=A0A3P7CFX1_SCHSO|nr:unnamed protein product [Schistocephalus solidus]
MSEKFEDTIILKAGASTVVEVPFMASPKPTVEWTWKSPVEGSQPTKPRFKPDVAAGLTSLPLGKVKREDAGDYTVVIANELGESTVTVHLIVLDKPSPPRNPQVTDNTGERVVFEWQEPEFPGGEPGSTLEYVVEMREASMRTGKPVTKTTELSTPIEPLQIDKTYVFMVAAKNSVGQSDFVEAKPVSTKLDFGPPPTPVNVVARVRPANAPPSEQLVEVSWDQPTDQTAPTTARSVEYEVEMKPEDSSLGTLVGVDIPITETTLPVPLELMKDLTNYQFRVTAKNKAGKSKASQPSSRVQKREFPFQAVRPSTLPHENPLDGLARVVAVDVDFLRRLENVDLQELPKDVLFECELSRPGMTINWLKDGTPVKPNYRCTYEVIGEGVQANCVHRLALLNVGPGDQGVYTAQLVNGLTSEAQLSINCPPKINYSGPKRLEMAAGKSTVIEVPYSGSPAPSVNWSFNQGPLPIGPSPEKPMSTVDTVYGLTSMQLRRVDGAATGTFLVQVCNDFGKDQLELTVNVLDRPQPVENLRAKLVQKELTTAEVSWKPPQNDGGAPITAYVVEKREASKRTWTPLPGGPISATIVTVSDLKPGLTYFFRVMAQNANGWSEPAETESPLRVEALSKPPAAPDAPKVSEVTATTCQVTIQPPSSDGGSPLRFYHLEKQANQKGSWVRACKDKLPIPVGAEEKPLTVTVTDLVADNAYEFRVAAENADCLTGEFSRPSDRVSTKPPFSKIINKTATFCISWLFLPSLAILVNEGAVKNISGVINLLTCCLLDVPGRPSRPELKMATENTATVTWSPPYDDGGDTVKKYTVQYKTTNGIHWATCEEEPIDTELTVLKLQPDSEYEFRVAAINSAGTGEFSQPSEPCSPEKAVESAKPVLVRPLENATVSVKTPVDLSCDFKLGEPKASVTWLKDGKPLRGGTKCTTSPASDRHATLRITRCQFEDAGVFTCRAENAAGSVETTCRVRVLQKPTLRLVLPRGASEKVTGSIVEGQLTGQANGRLVLEAFTEAFPACESLTWYFNNTPAEAAPPRRVIEREKPATGTEAPIPTRERLILHSLEQADTGVYRVLAKNEVGQAEAVVALLITDRPQPPTSVTASRIRKPDSCLIEWKRPPADGGSKITQYVVEGLLMATSTKEAATPMRSAEWTVIGKVGPSDLEFEAKNLRVGSLYAFRVSAENAIGRSEPVEIENPIALEEKTGRYFSGTFSFLELRFFYTGIRESLDLPEAPVLVSATRDSPREATIKWQPTASADLRNLIGYVVEARESPDIATSTPNRWVRVGPCTVRQDTTLRLNDLNPSMDVQFRVLAKNNAGLSEPSEPSEWLTKPTFEEKTIRPSREKSSQRTEPDGALPSDGLPSKPQDILEELKQFKEAIRPKPPVPSEPPGLEILAGNNFNVREGGSLRVPVRVKSKARATLELETESGRALPSEAAVRCQVEQFGDSYYVNLRNVCLADSGRYRLKVSNAAGHNYAPLELQVTAIPQAPRGPIEVTEVQPAKGPHDGAVVKLTWRPPALREGETPNSISGYTVEQREGKRRPTFGRPKRVDGVENCSIEVSDLQPGVEYNFRLCAVNSEGASEPLYSGPVSVKSPFDVPGTCEGPVKVSEQTTNSLTLQWKPPKEDGGLPIRRYHLEVNEVGSPEGWQPLTSVAAPTTSYPVSGLREGIAYRFRVRAVNDQGPGDWLPTDSAISLNRPISAPSAPDQPLKIVPVDDTSAQLTWRPPFDDGGSPLDSYIVQSSHGKARDWQPVGTTKDTTLTVRDLNPDETYTFRVSAKNKADKVSDAVYSIPYKPSSPPVPPGPPTQPFVSHPLEVGQMLLDWGPSPVGGTSGYGPPNEYRVERWEPVKDRWVHVARKPAAEGTTVVVSGLKPGESYLFRVFAENAAGTSSPLEMSKPVLAVSPYSPPSAPRGPMHISEVQKGTTAADGSARLSWLEPTDDGGLPLTGYLVQLRYLNSPAWHKIAYLREPSGELMERSQHVELPTSVPVTGLKQAQSYVFRVAAVNKVGTGPFLESETFEMPVDESCKPKAEWVRVVSKGADNLSVEWLVPHDCRKDHGPKRAHHLALDGFRVYIKDAAKPEEEWKPVADLDHYMNRLVVGGLSPDKRYFFGVAAVNQFGPGEIVSTSEPSSPEAITNVPGQPLGPLSITDITQDSCVLNWKAPLNDGGTPITGYRIYKREMFRRSKQEVGRYPVPQGSHQHLFDFKVPYLMEGTSYEFQVVAENKKGFSEPLTTAVDVHPRKMTEAPGAPRGPLYVREGEVGTVEISWAPPVNTGGLPVKGYKLEVREGRGYMWRTYPNAESVVASKPAERANPMCVVSGIKPNREYFFRVSAINEDGTGTPLTTADSYVKRVNLAIPTQVTARPVKASEDANAPVQIEVTWASPNLPNLTGFVVEMLDAESPSAEWVPMDFVPLPSAGQDSYIYRTPAPRPFGVFKFRVCATYTEGKSDWIPSDFVVLSERTTAVAASRPLPPISKARLLPERGADEKSDTLPALLEWEKPIGAEEQGLRGYTIEAWDTKKETWKPLTDVPRDAPREVALELPASQAAPRLRIVARGDTERSAPYEVPIIPTTSHLPTGARAFRRSSSDWRPVASTTGLSRLEDSDLLASTGAATPSVAEFIHQRRQAAIDMVRRATTGTPRGTSRASEREHAPLEQRLYEERFISSSPHRPGSSAMPSIRSGKLLVRDVDQTTATVEWPRSVTGTPLAEDLSTFSVELWRPTSGRWSRLADLPATQREYTVPVTGLPRTPLPEGVPTDKGLWLRVVPRDVEGRPVGKPFQLEEPLPIVRGEFVPSAVWGVEIKPVLGSASSRRQVEVSWRPPSHIGGSPLTNYRLRIYDATTEKETQVFVQPNTNSHRIDGLLPDHDYRISITACNRIGDSLPVTSTIPRPFLLEDGYLQRPAPPSTVEFSSSPREGASSGILSWRAPSRPGQPVDSYVVDKWDSRSKQWVPFKKVPGNVTKIEVPHLLDDVLYAFRVHAHNEAGLSEPTATAEYFRPGRGPEELLPGLHKPPPAPPIGPLKVESSPAQQRLDQATEQAQQTMILSWSKPTRTEDVTEPKDYVLEARRNQQPTWSLIGRKPLTEGEWWPLRFGAPTPQPLLATDLYPSQQALLDLNLPRPSVLTRLPGEPTDYEFRLSTENEYGLSQPIYLQRRPSYQPSYPGTPLTPALGHIESPLATDTLSPLERPRGPISLSILPSRKFQPQESDFETAPDVSISWRPPISTHGIRAYDISYREPYRSTWKHLGTADVTASSFVIPATTLQGLPETLHIGIASIGSEDHLAPRISPRLEETLLLPSSTRPEFDAALRSGLSPSPITSAKVDVRILERPVSRIGSDSTPEAVEVSWKFPDRPPSPLQRRGTAPDSGYMVFYRELGSPQWQEAKRLPAGRPIDSILLRDLPSDLSMFIGVAPLRGQKIGPIISSPDTIRLSARPKAPYSQLKPLSTSLPLAPLHIRPISLTGVEVTWEPPVTLPDHFKPTAEGRMHYELEVRRPGQQTWTPVGRQQPTPRPLESTVGPLTPVSFTVDNLQPGERLEFRLMTIPDLKTGPIKVSDERSYRFLPSYDIPAAPRGPLVTELKPALTDRLPAPTPRAHLPDDEFDELLYRLSTTSRLPPTLLDRKPQPATPDAISLSWRAPEDTGGLPVTHYLVEQRLPDRPTSWMPVLTVPAEQTTAYLPLSDLRTPSGPRFYRVRAVNQAGPGLPLQTTEPIIVPTLDRLPTTAQRRIPESRMSSPREHRFPEAPRGPLRAQLLPDSRVELSWQPPVHWPEYSPYQRREGAVSPAYPNRYIIEATLEDKPGVPWIEVGRVPGSITSTTVRLPSADFFPTGEQPSSVSPLRPVLYRVRAENEYGYSAPLTTRLEPSKGPQYQRLLPPIPLLPMRARLLQPMDAELRIGESPKVELQWSPYLPPADVMRTAPGRDKWVPKGDFNYVLEYRPVGERGWRHLSTLPIGQETLVFRPPPVLSSDLPKSDSNFGHPITEGYQFRVGVRGPGLVTDYSESNVVSWTYRPESPPLVKRGSLKPSRPSNQATAPLLPTPSAIRPPEHFQFVRAKAELPREPLSDWSPPRGTVTLRWRAPSVSGVPSALSPSFVLQHWSPETGGWSPVAYKATPFPELGHGGVEATIEHLHTNQPHFFRVATSSPFGTSEPIHLPHPIWIPVESPRKQAPPEPPTRLFVSPIMRDRPGFLLTWSPPELPISRRLDHRTIPVPPSGYVVEYRTLDSTAGTRSPAWRPLADLPASQTSFEMINVEPGRTLEFRVMSRGSPVMAPASLSAPFRRSSLKTEPLSSILSTPIESGPHMVPKTPLSIPSLSGPLEVTPVRTGVELHWTPPKELPSGYIVELAPTDYPHRAWQEVARIPGADLGRPVSRFTVPRLEADRPYIFRVIPYLDDYFGRPAESFVPYRPLEVDSYDVDAVRRPMAAPPPRGPLLLTRLPTGQYEISWMPPRLDIDTAGPQRVEYVIEQRLPGRRQWFEVGRTPHRSYILDVDTTSQFRVRSFISQSPLLHETSTFPKSRNFFIGSDDGPQTEWIRVDEYPTSFKMPPARTESPLDRRPLVLPDKLVAKHIGPSSVLLQWEFRDLPKDHEPGRFYVLEQKLIPDSPTYLTEPVWEPIARIPYSPICTTYEVMDLTPGRTYNFRLIDRTPGLDETTPIALRGVTLPEPIKTTGGYLRRSSLPTVTDFVLMPRKFSAQFLPTPGAGLSFSWLPPQNFEGQTDRIKYRIEGRPIGDHNASWVTIADALTNTHYILTPTDIKGLVIKQEPRLQSRVPGLPSRPPEWEFRIISTLDGASSRPRPLPTPISLVSEEERKELHFVNMDDVRDVKCVLGQTLVVIVNVEGHPKPSVNWYLNGTEIFEGVDSNLRFLSRGAGTYELRINRVDYIHEGEIKFRARNLYEEIVRTWHVHINAPARFSRTVFLAGQSDHRVTSGGNWNVDLPLDLPFQILRRKGWVNKVWLECVWRPKGRLSPELLPPVERRAKIGVSECGRWVHLNLDRVQPQDAGLYRIWIENPAGRDYFDVRLHVDDKPHGQLQPPTVHLREPGLLLLRWQPPSTSEEIFSSTGYRIEYTTDREPENWLLLGTTPVTQTEVLVSDQLPPGLRYRFRIRMQNLLGLGPASAPSEYEILEMRSESRLSRLSSTKPPRISDGIFEERYEILEELARTPHAQIYRVRDRLTKKIGLSKVLNLETLPDVQMRRSSSTLMEMRPTIYTPTTRIRHFAEEERRKRAERELRLLTSIQHQNMVDLRDVFLDAKRLIWVIEDLVPVSLWDQLRNRITMNEDDAAVVIRQILNLLNSLHTEDISYVGLSPENLFFADKGRQRIVLGGATQYQRYLEDRPVRLSFRSTIYVPPEIYSAERRNQRCPPEVSPATDTWSVGALLYQIITGDTTNRPSIAELERRKVSPVLIDFARKLLEPDPTKRPTIEEALQHPWLTAEPRSTPSKLIEVEEKIRESRRRFEEATSRAYKSLLHSVDWQPDELDEEEEGDDDLAFEERRKRRRLLLTRRRWSYTDFNEVDGLGKDEVAFNVLLRARGRAPQIAVPMANTEVAEGKDAVLKCVLSPSYRPGRSGEQEGLNDIKVIWAVNGREIDLHSVGRLASKYSADFDASTGEATLRVRNTNVYDVGTYSVTFCGRFGVINDSANLRVLAGPTGRRSSRDTASTMTAEIGARITRPLVDHTIVAGEPLKFQIRVCGIPKPTCTWRRNGKDLEHNPTCRIRDEPVVGTGRTNEIICTLEIRRAELSDAGSYNVTASNKNGSDSSSAIVTILPEQKIGSSVPRFVTELSNSTVVEGGSLTLEAQVEGFPEPQIRWFKDGKLLATFGRLTAQTMETSIPNRLKCQLSVEECTSEDSGAYVCAATSASGTAISEAVVSVKTTASRPGLGQRRRSSELRSALLTSRSHPPEFIQRLRPQEVSLGEPVRLSAAVMATPQASIIWEKDGVPLVTDTAASPYLTKNLNGNLELRIKNCSTAELGKYTVVAYNSAGEARSSCVLSGKTETVFHVPRFIKQLTDQYLSSGQRVVFEVEASGNPTPEFKWEKDGFELRQDTKPTVIISSRAAGRATLTIPVVEAGHAGLYSCIAHNRVGRDRTSSFVYVDGGSGSVSRMKESRTSTTAATESQRSRLPPRPAGAKEAHVCPTTGGIEVLTDLPKAVEVNEGEELRLTCTIKTDLHVIPTWSKGGRTLTFDGRRRITRNLQGEFCLTIDQAMSNDAGRYTLTIQPSDLSQAATEEPVVLNTRVDVKPKARTKIS